MNVPEMINCFIYTRMIGETPKWVQNFVFIIPILGENQIKIMEEYTGEQIMIIMGGLMICLIVLILAGKKYIDTITKNNNNRYD